MKKPYEPTFADRKRIEAGDILAASPNCICEACGLEFWHHRTVKDHPDLVKVCDGRFARIE